MSQVKILGLIDLITLIPLFGLTLKFDVPIIMLIFISLILLPKAFIAPLSIGGLIDITVVGLLLTSIFIQLPFWIPLIAMIVIGQKGIASLLAHGDV